MKMVHCFTSATFSYLGRARVLARTVKQYHPDWVFWLCLCDVPPKDFAFNPAQEPFDRIITIEQLEIPNLPRWMFGHDIVELSTAVKGQMMWRLLQEPSANKIIYLDPDIAVFNPLAHVLDLLDRHPVVLTPHQVQPETHPQAVVDNEIGSLKHGIYNLGFIAVANIEEGRRLACWWRDRLLVHCRDALAEGLFTDQRWCDLIPAMFESPAILRDPGYNVASWNLSQRQINIDPDGRIRVNGALLRFFHFTKVDTAGELMLERYGGESLALFELLAWYRRMLRTQQPNAISSRYWHYGKYHDGREIVRPERRLYRERLDLQATFPNPYCSGSDSYQSWYSANAG